MQAWASQETYNIYIYHSQAACAIPTASGSIVFYFWMYAVIDITH